MSLKLDRLARAVPRELFLDGQWRKSSDGTTKEVTNPADARTLGTIEDASVTDAVAALSAADRAQTEWGLWSARDRASVLYQAHSLMLERAEDLAAAVVYETGKPLSEARAEVSAGAEAFLWNVEQVAHLAGTHARASRGGFEIVTRHVPVGPCLLITPWNFPVLTPQRKIGAALAAGCTVVFKPAPQTPLAALLLTEIFADVGLPAGVFNLVTTTRDRDMSAALMADLRLRKLSFTGSTAVGSQLLRQAASLAINSSMELGGNAPFIVLADADVDLAVSQAIACKFRNAGQVCIAPNRFIVDAAVASDFTKKLTAAVSELQLGSGFDKGVQVGPMISARQRMRALNLLDSAVDGGATIHTGGVDVEGAGFFFEPAVVTGVPRDSPLATEEIFAPIATIYEVASTEAAVSLANATDRGLAAYVFSTDLREALRVADQIEAGVIGVNRSNITDPAAPFGGVKASGIGREGGHDAIHEYMEVKYLAVASASASASA